MTQQRFTLPSAVFLLLERQKDGKRQLVLMRRANTSWHNGDYDLPAGHIDGGESNSAAMVREAQEEIGITVDTQDLVFALLSHNRFEDGKEYYNVYFRAPAWSGHPTIMEPDKCDALDWFDYDALPANLTPNTRLGLQALADGRQYFEYGF